MRVSQQLRDATARLAQIEAILADAGLDDCVCDRIAAVLNDTSAPENGNAGRVRSRRRG